MTALLNNKVLFEPFIPKTTTAQDDKEDTQKSVCSTISLRWKQPNLCKEILLFFFVTLPFAPRVRFFLLLFLKLCTVQLYTVIVHDLCVPFSRFFFYRNEIKTSSPFCVWCHPSLFASLFVLVLFFIQPFRRSRAISFVLADGSEEFFFCVVAAIRFASVAWHCLYY